MKNHRKIVEVEWIDAQSSIESWTEKELKEEFKPMTSMCCGYLIHETEEYIILGYMDFANGLIKHNTCIPKGMIKNMKVIRRGR